MNDPENPIELAFQQRYGEIIAYHWSVSTAVIIFNRYIIVFWMPAIRQLTRGFYAHGASYASYQENLSYLFAIIYNVCDNISEL